MIRNRRGLWSFTLVGAAALCCLAFTGCTTPSEPPDAHTHATDEADGDTPEFSGPWAEEFRSLYREAPNDKIRAMLEDEQISDAEKQAVTEEFRNCLAAKGVTFKDFEDDGSFDFSFDSSVKDGEQANDYTYECSASTGVDSVIGIYYSMRSNPKNEDMSEGIVACLIRSGVVPSNYSVKDYKSTPIEDVSTASEEEAITAAKTCEADPKGAYGG